MGDGVIDDGILTNSDQLPVIQLNYGGGGDRNSWIIYKLGSLECAGKGGEYPSEIEDRKLEKIEEDVERLKISTNQNDAEIDQLTAKTDILENDISTLQDGVIEHDYYFKYQHGVT